MIRQDIKKQVCMSKRPLEVKIGLVYARVNLYSNIEYKSINENEKFNTTEYFINGDTEYFINGDIASPSFMVRDMIEICPELGIESFAEIESIKLLNNSLGYEFYSEQDIKRVLKAIQDMADIVLIRLGFLNSQTNEMVNYPNINTIKTNIVPTYKKYGFVDVSPIIGGYEGSIVMCTGKGSSRLKSKAQEACKETCEEKESVDTKKKKYFSLYTNRISF